ncbi:quinone oxidoreductase [Sphingobium phenoxybenzoativorans]|uniref:Quinone oxidoreductase n=1 Tax=Sphingobium phenoxybenzoativorans TaxID=1592790 RepID=A0A975Q1Y2_9SPHN|nr:quinone oxidoreductase [Sphingobium phenoxybenzoativorans]QUT06116.1 quinone oxidoreductase [Sphingobium phenoxybenzoativorans]
MADAWRLIIRAHGGPEVIEREDFQTGDPGPGEILIAHEAIGLNFIDTYVRSGLYPSPLPAALGAEAAGTVIAVGPGVTGIAPGDRVAHALGAHGSYATHRLMPANRVLKLPDAISCETAAATLLKGMTAAFLAEDCGRMESGQAALVHAAAGGVGSILVPWLASLGVTVIAHSGSEEKAALARAAGAAHSLTGPYEALAEQVRGLTDGEGVHVVFDGVGKASWDASLASLRIRGLLATYGNASGPVPPIDVLSLSRGGSLFVTRPTLYDYAREDADLQRLGARLFDQIAKGVVKADINQRFALADAADAHRALEARQTTGSTVLIP